MSLVDMVDDGIRPVVDRAKCVACGDCLRACPGLETAHDPESWPEGTIRELRAGWGPVLEVWEGHAADDRIRHCGSSGGAASVLALYCVEREGMEAVLHTGPDPRMPWKSATVRSTRRHEMVERTGSRYAPASPCDGLGAAVAGLGPWVFIGKPCDVAGVRRAAAVRPEVVESIGCCISIFCAGTPSTRGTLNLLNRFGVAPPQVREFRFRGRGWPGHTAVRREGEDELHELFTYEECWSFLQRFRPYRCHLCPDGTGELADIACGDPWCRTPQPGEAGRSLVLVRTERGREIVRGALREGYLRLRRRSPRVLVDSQPSLYRKRCAVWGRCAAFRACGLPTPVFRGFSLGANWRRLPSRQKVRSFFGTLRRIVSRGYFRPSNYLAGEAREHRSLVPGRSAGIRIAEDRDTRSRTLDWIGIGDPNPPQ